MSIKINGNKKSLDSQRHPSIFVISIDPGRFLESLSLITSARVYMRKA